ncbi:hypothetical protein EAI_03746 [Harpegnathos saltator]|uniref:Uncharacterized protein n=1 Tax=Harpegnathos saltator TaxID=610380 RepID=E2B842_HARSA|nr:hypothetical protein EAI_03746 [Harpegnathos saltator]
MLVAQDLFLMAPAINRPVCHSDDSADHGEERESALSKHSLLSPALQRSPLMQPHVIMGYKVNGEQTDVSDLQKPYGKTSAREDMPPLNGESGAPALFK